MLISSLLLGLEALPQSAHRVVINYDANVEEKSQLIESKLSDLIPLISLNKNWHANGFGDRLYYCNTKIDGLGTGLLLSETFIGFQFF